MISAPQPKNRPFSSYRLKLLLAMMLVVSSVAAIGLILAQRSAAAGARRGFEREFQQRIASLQAVEGARNAVLGERCRELALRPRIHAALEDNALDLLYPSARDELLDLLAQPASPAEPGVYPLHARLYRFLDATGKVIPPHELPGLGRLTPAEEVKLSLPSLPDKPQIGYFWRQAAGGEETIDELIAMPVFSTETGEVISTIVLGFRPDMAETKSGLYTEGRLYLPALDPAARGEIAAAVGRVASRQAEGSFSIRAAGTPYLLFYKLLNPGSLYPPASEIILYTLSGLLATQRHLYWQFSLAAAILLCGALAASNFLSARLSVPVEKLAVDSAENLAQRQRAEQALEFTHKELERSARFSADASHQLKTPVTVLRAGLEELLAGENLPPATREEISALIHQTFRLTSIVEDLLLLSRLDAGRFQIHFSPVNLRALIEAGLDDLETMPDESDLTIETDLPAALTIKGEKRYTSLILQNVLENARKYNRPGGRIRLAAREEDIWTVVTIANTGTPIPPAAQEHIFERFHRGAVGENLPGHGLGLNLARELARFHGGDLRLLRSDEAWTEFELRLHRWTGAEGSAPVVNFRATLGWKVAVDLRATAMLFLLLSPFASSARADDDFLDPLDQALSVSADHDNIRARLSGTLDLEGYEFDQPPPGLIVAGGTGLFAPRLTLYLDAQLGPALYAFAAFRADRGFDPTAGALRGRLDEYALRYTPWVDGRFNLQAGKFATVVGNWTPRHDSWENAFITAPLPYENLTGIWYVEAARSAATLSLWANVGPRPSTFFPIKSRSVPIIWGPSYAPGAAVSGILGQLSYAVEAKNASLSSPPDVWGLVRMPGEDPTVSGRIGWSPDESWNLGFSASTGPYLRSSAEYSLPPGAELNDYREVLFGQDAAFAWHHWQLWSEVFETRFDVPEVGTAATVAYYLEARFKATPQLALAARWNQQVFSTLPDPAGGSDRWGANTWRIDLGPAYRFTPHLQLKLQYSFQEQDSAITPRNHLLAAQLTARF